LKATGVVRRIDDLGRVVIPKEIRKTLRIKEGDPLETTLEQLRILTESLQILDLQNI
jgi:AbrB family looped-hinge helix DNA binding protein